MNCFQHTDRDCKSNTPLKSIQDKNEKEYSVKIKEETVK